MGAAEQEVRVTVTADASAAAETDQTVLSLLGDCSEDVVLSADVVATITDFDGSTHRELLSLETDEDTFSPGSVQLVCLGGRPCLLRADSAVSAAVLGLGPAPDADGSAAARQAAEAARARLQAERPLSKEMLQPWYVGPWLDRLGGDHWPRPSEECPEGVGELISRSLRHQQPPSAGAGAAAEPSLSGRPEPAAAAAAAPGGLQRGHQMMARAAQMTAVRQRRGARQRQAELQRQTSRRLERERRMGEQQRRAVQQVSGVTDTDELVNRLKDMKEKWVAGEDQDMVASVQSVINTLLLQIKTIKGADTASKLRDVLWEHFLPGKGQIMLKYRDDLGRRVREYQYQIVVLLEMCWVLGGDACEDDKCHLVDLLRMISLHGSPSVMTDFMEQVMVEIYQHTQPELLLELYEEVSRAPPASLLQQLSPSRAAPDSWRPPEGSVQPGSCASLLSGSGPGSYSATLPAARSATLTRQPSLLEATRKRQIMVPKLKDLPRQPSNSSGSSRSHILASAAAAKAAARARVSSGSAAKGADSAAPAAATAAPASGTKLGERRSPAKGRVKRNLFDSLGRSPRRTTTTMSRLVASQRRSSAHNSSFVPETPVQKSRVRSRTVSGTAVVRESPDAKDIDLGLTPRRASQRLTLTRRASFYTLDDAEGGSRHFARARHHVLADRLQQSAPAPAAVSRLPAASQPLMSRLFGERGRSADSASSMAWGLDSLSSESAGDEGGAAVPDTPGRRVQFDLTPAKGAGRPARGQTPKSILKATAGAVSESPDLFATPQKGTPKMYGKRKRLFSGTPKKPEEGSPSLRGGGALKSVATDSPPARREFLTDPDNSAASLPSIETSARVALPPDTSSHPATTPPSVKSTPPPTLTPQVPQVPTSRRAAQMLAAMTTPTSSARTSTVTPTRTSPRLAEGSILNTSAPDLTPIKTPRAVEPQRTPSKTPPRMLSAEQPASVFRTPQRRQSSQSPVRCSHLPVQDNLVTPRKSPARFRPDIGTPTRRLLDVTKGDQSTENPSAEVTNDDDDDDRSTSPVVSRGRSRSRAGSTPRLSRTPGTPHTPRTPHTPCTTTVRSGSSPRTERTPPRRPVPGSPLRTPTRQPHLVASSPSKSPVVRLELQGAAELELPSPTKMAYQDAEDQETEETKEAVLTEMSPDISLAEGGLDVALGARLASQAIATPTSAAPEWTSLAASRERPSFSPLGSPQMLTPEKLDLSDILDILGPSPVKAGSSQDEAAVNVERAKGKTELECMIRPCSVVISPLPQPLDSSTPGKPSSDRFSSSSYPRSTRLRRSCSESSFQLPDAARGIDTHQSLIHEGKGTTVVKLKSEETSGHGGEDKLRVSGNLETSSMRERSDQGSTPYTESFVSSSESSDSMRLNEALVMLNPIQIPNKLWKVMHSSQNRTNVRKTRSSDSSLLATSRQASHADTDKRLQSQSSETFKHVKDCPASAELEITGNACGLYEARIPSPTKKQLRHSARESVPTTNADGSEVDNLGLSDLAGNSGNLLNSNEITSVRSRLKHQKQKSGEAANDVCNVTPCVTAKDMALQSRKKSQAELSCNSMTGHHRKRKAHRMSPIKTLLGDTKVREKADAKLEADVNDRPVADNVVKIEQEIVNEGARANIHLGGDSKRKNMRLGEDDDKKEEEPSENVSAKPKYRQVSRPKHDEVEPRVMNSIPDNKEDETQIATNESSDSEATTRKQKRRVCRKISREIQGIGSPPNSIDLRSDSGSVLYGTEVKCHNVIQQDHLKSRVAPVSSKSKRRDQRKKHQMPSQAADEFGDQQDVASTGPIAVTEPGRGSRSPVDRLPQPEKTESLRKRRRTKLASKRERIESKRTEAARLEEVKIQTLRDLGIDLAGMEAHGGINPESPGPNQREIGPNGDAVHHHPVDDVNYTDEGLQRIVAPSWDTGRVDMPACQMDASTPVTKKRRLLTLCESDCETDDSWVDAETLTLPKHFETKKLKENTYVAYDVESDTGSSLKLRIKKRPSPRTPSKKSKLKGQFNSIVVDTKDNGLLISSEKQASSRSLNEKKRERRVTEAWQKDSDSSIPTEAHSYNDSLREMKPESAKALTANKRTPRNKRLKNITDENSVTPNQSSPSTRKKKKEVSYAECSEDDEVILDLMDGNIQDFHISPMRSESPSGPFSSVPSDPAAWPLPVDKSSATRSCRDNPVPSVHAEGNQEHSAPSPAARGAGDASDALGPARNVHGTHPDSSPWKRPLALPLQTPPRQRVTRTRVQDIGMRLEDINALTVSPVTARSTAEDGRVFTPPTALSLLNLTTSPIVNQMRPKKKVRRSLHQ